MGIEKILRKIGSIAVLSTAFLTGCQDNYENRLKQELKDKGFSEEQADVGVVIGHRLLLMNERKEVKEDEGSVRYHYDFNYGGITITDMLGKVTQITDDLESALSRKNTFEEEKFIERFGLRPQLEKKRTLYTYFKDVLQQQELSNTFRDVMGLRPYSWNTDPHKVRADEAYSLGRLFPSETDVVFDAKYVQDARTAGKLTSDQFVVESITRNLTFDEKVPNPDYPLKDPNNQFVFKKRTHNVRITTWDLDGDENKRSDYIEAYRLDAQGKPETKPALKLFKPTYSDELAVVVVDKDKETDKKGFGKPDSVQRVYGIEKGSDLLSDANKHHIEELFTENDVPPVPQLDPDANIVHIVQTGQYPFTQYEIKSTGWEHALPDYKRDPFLSRFTVYVKFEQVSNEELNHEQQRKPRKIEWIAKRYQGPERVVEYYKPNQDIAGKSFTRVTINFGELEVFPHRESARKYTIDDAVEARPYRIDFDVADKRWIILNKDKDNKHYEAKQEIRKPDDLKLPQLPR